MGYPKERGEDTTKRLDCHAYIYYILGNLIYFRYVMSVKEDPNTKFDKRADALRANLMRRKKAKRDAANNKAAKDTDGGNNEHSVEDKGNQE